MLYIAYSIISVFSCVVRRSRVFRSDKVIAYLVYISIIRGINTRVKLVILAQSSYHIAKGLGRLRRAIFSIRIKRWRSSFGLVGPLDPIDVSEMLPEFKVGLYSKEEVLGALVERKSTPKFFKVFAIFIKVIDLVPEPDKGINVELG
jgi:hypothetical protein